MIFNTSFRAKAGYLDTTVDCSFYIFNLSFFRIFIQRCTVCWLKPTLKTQLKSKFYLFFPDHLTFQRVSAFANEGKLWLHFFQSMTLDKVLLEIKCFCFCFYLLRQRLFNAIETMPCVTKKAQWALNWINPQRVCQVKFCSNLVTFERCHIRAVLLQCLVTFLSKNEV